MFLNEVTKKTCKIYTIFVCKATVCGPLVSHRLEWRMSVVLLEFVAILRLVWGLCCSFALSSLRLHQTDGLWKFNNIVLNYLLTGNHYYSFFHLPTVLYSKVQWFWKIKSDNHTVVWNCCRTPIQKFHVFTLPLSLGGRPQKIRGVTLKWGKNFFSFHIF